MNETVFLWKWINLSFVWPTVTSLCGHSYYDSSKGESWWCKLQSENFSLKRRWGGWMGLNIKDFPTRDWHLIPVSNIIDNEGPVCQPALRHSCKRCSWILCWSQDKWCIWSFKYLSLIYRSASRWKTSGGAGWPRICTMSNQAASSELKN